MKSLLFILSAFLGFISCRAQDWELSKAKNGIKVYTRKSENSPIKAFRVVTTMQGNMGTLLAALRNPISYPLWYDHCKKTEVISNDGDRLIYYVEMSMPFPFDNRDIVYEMIVKQTEASAEIIYRALTGVKDETDGLVRMDYAKGSWIISSSDGVTSTIIHEFEGDPKGNVPAGIVNLFIVQGPINTIERLKEYIRKK